jgi:hypothetical protein
MSAAVIGGDKVYILVHLWWSQVGTDWYHLSNQRS